MDSAIDSVSIRGELDRANMKIWKLEEENEELRAKFDNAINFLKYLSQHSVWSQFTDILEELQPDQYIDAACALDKKLQKHRKALLKKYEALGNKKASVWKHLDHSEGPQRRQERQLLLGIESATSTTTEHLQNKQHQSQPEDPKHHEMDNQKIAQSEKPEDKTPPSRDFIRRRDSWDSKKRKPEGPQVIESFEPLNSEDITTSTMKTPGSQIQETANTPQLLGPSTPPRNASPLPQNLRPQRRRPEKDTPNRTYDRTPSPSPGRIELVCQPKIQWSTPVGPSARLSGGVKSTKTREDERSLEERLGALKTEDVEDAWEDADDDEGNEKNERDEKRKRID